MKTKNVLLAALLATAIGPVLGDEFGGEDAQAGVSTEPRIVTRHLTGSIQVELGRLDEVSIRDGLPFSTALIQTQRGVVKNAPYSAEIISERLQRLGDGNQIINRSRLKNYRDGEGRTRTEVVDGEGRVGTITIHDPVAGTRWLLHPGKKHAIRIAPSPEIARAAAAQARAAAEKARGSVEHARRAAAEARTKIDQLRQDGKLPDARSIVTEARRGAHPTEVRIRVAEPGATRLAATREMSAQIGPMIVGAMGDSKWAAQTVTRDLGTRDFSGVRARGQQRSYEIPAGELGNRDPITVSSETWTSPELQLMVYHKHSDPRTGELVYRLEGLKREEPAPELFTVPPDYQSRDSVVVTGEASPRRKQGPQ